MLITGSQNLDTGLYSESLSDVSVIVNLQFIYIRYIHYPPPSPAITTVCFQEVLLSIC